MSERSAKWLKKRSFLDQREAEVKNELASASNSLESGVKMVLVATAAVGATFLTGYVLYRAFSKPKKKPEKEVTVETNRPKVVKKVKKRQKFSIKSAIIERLALTLIQIIGTQIAILLSKSKQGGKEQT